MDEFISQQVIIFTDQNQNLYQLDVQVSQFQEIQQNQGVSLKCLEQIAKIQQNLEKKYSNMNILQVDTNYKDIKKKRIRKIKQYNDTTLNTKIRRHKQNLNRLWALRLVYYFKKNSKKYSAFKKINLFKNQMLSATNISQISKIFQQNPWVGKILEKQNEHFLNFLKEQKKISDQSKLILFQTFDILLEGAKHPKSLISWDSQLNSNIKESKQLLMKLKDKSFQEIHQLAVLQYQKQKQHYQSNKCSTYNNLSYFWFKYLKDIFDSEEFNSTYQSDQMFERLQFTFPQSPTIPNIRNVLQIKQLAQYILNTKIESKLILSQLVLNGKINLLNKINMMISLNQFINAVKDPSTLHKWIN